MQIEKRVERRETKKSDMVICHLAAMPGDLKKDALSPLIPSATGFVLWGAGVMVLGGILLSSD